MINKRYILAIVLIVQFYSIRAQQFDFPNTSTENSNYVGKSINNRIFFKELDTTIVFFKHTKNDTLLSNVVFNKSSYKGEFILMDIYGSSKIILNGFNDGTRIELTYINKNHYFVYRKILVCNIYGVCKMQNKKVFIPKLIRKVIGNVGNVSN